jgi:hypothetical protein
MLALELLIARYLGKTRYQHLVQDFADRDRLGFSSGLATRREETIGQLL